VKDLPNGKVIAVCAEKGGVGKTATTINFGIGLAREGRKVCIVDCDSSADMTKALGHLQPRKIFLALPNLFSKIINNGGIIDVETYPDKQKYIQRGNGFDYITSRRELSSVENMLVGLRLGRERIFTKIINIFKDDFDYIIVDCMPSLNLLTVNVLTAADSVLIPSEAEFLSATDVDDLLSTISSVRENLNPHLSIAGILLTKFDARPSFYKEVVSTLAERYDNTCKIFNTRIPKSVRVTESQALGKSLFDTFPKAKVTHAYAAFVKEFLDNE
jgi:chromosome partitioning protein